MQVEVAAQMNSYLSSYCTRKFGTELNQVPSRRMFSVENGLKFFPNPLSIGDNEYKIDSRVFFTLYTSVFHVQRFSYIGL